MMSFKEKKSLISVITGSILLISYCFYLFKKIQQQPEILENMKFWAVTILIFIGIGIVAMIVLQIVFHILMSIGYAIQKQIKEGSVDEKEIETTIKYEMMEDEMDYLINLKSMRIGYAFTGFTVLATILLLIFNFPSSILLHGTFFAFSLGSILEGICQLYFYKKGI